MDVLAHALLPLLCLLACRVPARRAALLAPLGVLPDIDGLLGPHRAVAHNLWAVALVALVIFALARTRVPDPGRLAALGVVVFGSHLLLDLPSGVALLYPMTSAAPVVHPALLVDMSGTLPVFVPHLNLDVLPAPVQFGDPPLPERVPAGLYVFIGAETFALLALLGLAFAASRTRGAAAGAPEVRVEAAARARR